MDKKLNPLQMVAIELAENSDMDYTRVETALIELALHLNDRAAQAIDRDEDSKEARSAAIQYRVFVEAIATFGTQLIAFEDMEEELPEEEESGN